MNLTKAILFIFLILFNAILAKSQTSVLSDSISISCILPKKISAGRDLNAKIYVKNISDVKVDVYSKFLEGDFLNISGDNYINLTLVVERKDNGIFHSYSNRSFLEPYSSIDSSIYPRKVTLSSKDSIINFFHLDSRYKFDVGNYRMKCLYWNNVKENKSIESVWVYFKVNKTIYIRR